MDLTRLIASLSDPAAYPEPVAAVEVRQTHISVVFLAGDFVYKVKKPVALGFLDFSTLQKRRHYCEEEVRLNRRLAPHVYLGVVPVTAAGDRLVLEGSGEPVEWAVKMRRLPEEATLLGWLRRGELTADRCRVLAERLAGFHAHAEGGPRVAPFGRFEVVAGNARENFVQSAAQVGVTISPGVFERLRTRTEEELARLRSLIESRAAQGVPRDTHGDLHLDHVYLFPDRPPPEDLVVIDCIEFNERFRFADPVADAAFLVMDLRFRGRRDLARAFADQYFTATSDGTGRELLPFYTAYRAAVRGKVEGLKVAEAEVPEEDRADARTRARAYWLLALGELESPGRRPALVLVGGLPGTGKSTLARGLADRAGFEVIRSDAVRKGLAGLSETAAGGPGLYTPEWTERTYAECLRRAEQGLFEGRRVVVDATFRAESLRRRFLESARHRGVPGILLICRAAPEAVHERLAGRHGDASDADWAVYRALAESWEEPGPGMRESLEEITTEGGPDEALAQALGRLQKEGLAE